MGSSKAFPDFALIQLLFLNKPGTMDFHIKYSGDRSLFCTLSS